MANVSITAANVAPSSLAVIQKAFNAGTTITQGELVYLDVNNLWQLASAATATACAVKGIAASAGSSGQPLAVVISDPALVVGGTLAVGSVYGVSTSAGSLAPATDMTTGNYASIVGIAQSTTALALYPIVATAAHA